SEPEDIVASTAAPWVRRALAFIWQTPSVPTWKTTVSVPISWLKTCRKIIWQAATANWKQRCRSYSKSWEARETCPADRTYGPTIAHIRLGGPEMNKLVGKNSLVLLAALT